MEEIDVRKYDIQDGQTILIDVPMENLSHEKAQEYLKGVLDAFQNEFARKGYDNVKMMVFPSRPGQSNPRIQTISPGKGDTVVLDVPLGSVPVSEASRYLKTVKNELINSGWNEQNPDVHLIVVGSYSNGRQVEIKVS